MASYQIEWKRSALKELEKLPRHLIPKIIMAVKGLAENPYPPGVKKLVGSEHNFRIREGDYRIVYVVYENKLIIEIVRVAHRKDVYR